MAVITYIQALRDGIREEMHRDERVFIMGEDVGLYGGAFKVTKGLLEEFGEERVRDTPISEAAIAGAAVGSALTGMRPVAEIMFSDFMTIAMDQIVNQAAKIRYMFGGKAKVPMVLRAPQGSGTGAAAQHSQTLVALFTHIPGLKVVMPSTPYDVKGLIKAAIRDDNPVIFMEHKLLYHTKGEVPEEEYIVPLGKADVKREGEDITIIAGSIMVPRALEAAEKLERKGIEVEVIDPRSLVPFDTETIIESVIKTGRVIIAEDDCKNAGWGAEVAAKIVESEAFDYLDAPIKRLAGLDTPIPYNPNLERAVVPQVEDIVKAVEEMLG
ncbi:MAG: acetoin:2,6-dichlorophenolindophenol oxidoreductase subunit beta [Thermosediminibacterales bacterium]|nr:acetoin:2,6-dichlorophenolindophenol oxidoreductase subunit beta [Thermosediminibacterales bacterium]MDK2835831.1 acetoin:2,6-dichlorophenolindophenol oxidoreductase subunit beta [Thermosediminibacterales bacterium]